MVHLHWMLLFPLSTLPLISFLLFAFSVILLSFPVQAFRSSVIIFTDLNLVPLLSFFSALERSLQITSSYTCSIVTLMYVKGDLRIADYCKWWKAIFDVIFTFVSQSALSDPWVHSVSHESKRIGFLWRLLVKAVFWWWLLKHLFSISDPVFAQVMFYFW